MEYSVSEELLKEAHAAACSDWKRRLEKEYPTVFQPKLEVGKWYKSTDDGSIVNYQGGKSGYGFNKVGKWYDNDGWTFESHPHEWIEATPAEVEAALRDETIKRYGKDWKNVKVKECLWHGKKQTNFGFNSPVIHTSENLIWNINGCLFRDGKWAEILPEEKTVITKEKALKILAKKYKTTVDKIEIK